MNNKPALDRSFIFPLVLSALSVVGLIVVLMIGRKLNAPAAVADTPSATPFQYLYLGTEPAITTPLVEGSEIPITDDPFEEEDPFEEDEEDGPIGQATPTALVLATATNGNGVPANTLTPTPTSVAPPPLTASTYDDTHSGITYNGDWTATISNNTTLHVSATAGNENTVTFRFIGNELRILYDPGDTLGQVRIAIETSEGTVVGTLDESNEAGEWQSARLPDGTHTVVITHSEGGPVNIDQIIILDFTATATPTVTPTP
jgi:hypothetical protein